MPASPLVNPTTSYRHRPLAARRPPLSGDGCLQLAADAPAGRVVALADGAVVRHRADDRPDFDLAMRLGGGLLGIRTFAPHQRDLRARLDELRLDDAERERAALVVAVAREHRRTDHLA